MTEQEMWQEYDKYCFLNAKYSNGFGWNATCTKYICTDMAKDFYRQAVKALDNPYGAINRGQLPPPLTSKFKTYPLHNHKIS